MSDTPTTRRRFLTRTLAAGAATVFVPRIFAACDEATGLLDDAGVDTSLPDVDLDTSLPDLDKLMETLTLDDGFLIADPSTGRLYRIDQEAHTVSQLDTDLSERWTYGGLGDGDDALNFPMSVSPNADGSVHVLDSGNQRLVHLDGEGNRLRTIGGPTDAQFSALRGGVVDGDGTVWVTDPHAHKVIAIGSDGTQTASFGELGEGATQLNGPRGVALDADGRLHVVDTGNARVQVFERDGTHVRSYGSYGEDDGRHLVPRGVAIAPNGLTYISDPVAGAVQVYDKAGTALARLDDLSLAGTPAVPLDVSISANGLVQVRLHTWTEDS